MHKGTFSDLQVLICTVRQRKSMIPNTIDLKHSTSGTQETCRAVPQEHKKFAELCQFAELCIYHPDPQL